VAIISREVNRSWSRPSLPSATSSGLPRTAAITWSNCSLPSECRRRTRQITGGEGRLLPRDAVQRDARITDDPGAVLPRDAPVILGSFGILAAIEAAHPAGPILCCGSSSMPWSA
jgi:hypothetical protein